MPKPKLLLKIAVSTLFVWYLAVTVDGQLLWKTARSVRTGFYILSFFCLVANSVILAKKYQVLMLPAGFRQTLWTLVKINFICRFYATFLTTAVGQGAIRWYLSTKDHASRIPFVGVMLVERATFLMALCAAVLVFWIAAAPEADPGAASHLIQIIGFCLIGSVAFVVGLGWPVVATAMGRLLDRILPERFRGEGFGLSPQKPAALAAACGIAILWHLVFLLRAWLLIVAMGLPVTFGDLGWIASIVLLLQSLPVSLSGIGIRETAYAYFFGTVGIPAEAGVVFGLLLLSQLLLFAAMGGLLNLMSAPNDNNLS